MTARRTRFPARAALATAALTAGLLLGGAAGFLAQGQPSPPVTPKGSGSTATLPAATPLAPDTLLAWTPGGLPDGYAAAAAGLPGVEHVVAVVSGTAWLTRSTNASGAVVDEPRTGFAIPIEVAAASPLPYMPFVSPADRQLVPTGPGDAVLSATSAQLRRIGVGGTLVLGGSPPFGPRVTLHVTGVVPDATIGAHEAFVTRDQAAALGLTTERYLLIEPVPGTSRERLTSRLRALLPAGRQLRVRGPGETPYFRQGDAVLPAIALKVALGEFAARPLPNGYLAMDPAWVERHIETAAVPILGHVTCNRGIVPQLRGALQEIERDGLAHLIDPGAYRGCFVPRFLNEDPTSSISHHTWGAAVDVNATTNRFGQTPHQDPRVVAIFERWGFTWGGRWLIPDGMHFEFVRFAPGG
jgi:hypothetical protein